MIPEKSVKERLTVVRVGEARVEAEVGRLRAVSCHVRERVDDELGHRLIGVGQAQEHIARDERG